MWILVLFIVVAVSAHHSGVMTNRKNVRDFIKAKLAASRNPETRYDAGYVDALNIIDRSFVSVSFQMPFVKKGIL